MAYLLDTHVMLWWMEKSPKLSKKAMTLIADPDNEIFVSAVSIWEIRIKESLGKIKLPSHFRKALDAQDFSYLPITVDHVDRIQHLPDIKGHKDPFDRLLIAQAISEKLRLISHDRIFKSYKISSLILS